MPQRNNHRRDTRRWLIGSAVVTAFMACAMPALAQVLPDDVARAFRQAVSPVLVLPDDEQAAMLYWTPPGAPPLYVGAAPVSTGKVGQFDHFETPTGVFAHTLRNPDFRAEGTKNANGILGYGAKGMRVYDFG